MSVLSVDRIRLGATAVDKTDAIRQAGLSIPEDNPTVCQNPSGER